MRVAAQGIRNDRVHGHVRVAVGRQLHGNRLGLCFGEFDYHRRPDMVGFAPRAVADHFEPTLHR